jgi:hypothetical protein
MDNTLQQLPERYIRRRAERVDFYSDVDVFCRINKIKRQEICDFLECPINVYTNMMTGFQTKTRQYKFSNFEEFKEMIIKFLGVEFQEFLDT